MSAYADTNVRSRWDVAGWLAGMLAASKAGFLDDDRNASGRGRERHPRPWLTTVSRLCLAPGLDGLIERQLAVLDGVRAVGGQRGVAVLVDRVRAQHGAAVLG